MARQRAYIGYKRAFKKLKRIHIPAIWVTQDPLGGQYVRLEGVPYMSLLPGVGLLIMNNIVMSEPFNERVVVGRIRKQGVIDASPLRFTPEPLPKRPRRRTNWYDAEAYLLDTRDHYKQLERERLQRAEERYYGDDL